MSDVPDASSSLSQPVIVWRRRRARKNIRNDIESADIEDVAQQEMTEASYSSYFGSFIAYAVKQGWASKFFSGFLSSGPVTADGFQRHKIWPICSTRNVENLRAEFSKNGRRRGAGLASRAMAVRV